MVGAFAEDAYGQGVDTACARPIKPIFVGGRYGACLSRELEDVQYEQSTSNGANPALSPQFGYNLFRDRLLMWAGWISEGRSDLSEQCL